LAGFQQFAGKTLHYLAKTFKEKFPDCPISETLLQFTEHRRGDKPRRMGVDRQPYGVSEYAG
jgi:hypothetical protein